MLVSPIRMSSQPFKRALGLFDAVMIVIGGIIGASVIRVSPVQSMTGAALMLAGVPAFYYWKRASDRRV